MFIQMKLFKQLHLCRGLCDQFWIALPSLSLLIHELFFLFLSNFLILSHNTGIHLHRFTIYFQRHVSYLPLKTATSPRSLAGSCMWWVTWPMWSVMQILGTDSATTAWSCVSRTGPGYQAATFLFHSVSVSPSSLGRAYSLFHNKLAQAFF